MADEPFPGPNHRPAGTSRIAEAGCAAIHDQGPLASGRTARLAALLQQQPELNDIRP